MLCSKYRGPPARIKTRPSEMTLPISQSIIQLAPHAWKLGEYIVCERVAVLPCGGIITSWRDETNAIWFLRRGRKSDARYVNNIPLTPYYRSGTSGAIWCLGGMYIKVKSWVEGMDPEAHTIMYAREKFPTMPVPEVAHQWVDIRLQRSFVILKPVPGRMLLNVWPSLSPHARQLVANQVAHYCSLMANETSNYMGSAVNPQNGVRDQYLCPERPVTTPSWKPISLPRIDEWNGQEYFNPVQLGRTFYFYHAELEPTNILVTNDGRVTGIVDWETAGFYPRCWISTKPQVAREFRLEGPGVNITEWQNLLSTALENRGFASERQDWDDFRGRVAGTVSTVVSFAKFYPANLNSPRENGESSQSAQNAQNVQNIQNVQMQDV